MKIEFNRQRIVGIAIVIIFLLVAIPFLLAGNKKSQSSTDEQMPLKIPSSAAQSDVASTVSSSASTKEDASLSDSSENVKDMKPDDPKNDVFASSESDSSNSVVTSAALEAQTSALPVPKAILPAPPADSPMAQTKQDSSAKSDLDEVSKVTQTKTVTKVVSPVKIAAKKNAKNVTQNKHKMASYNKNNKKQVTTPSSEKWLVRVGYHVPSEHSKSIVSSLHKIGYKNVYSKKMSINGKSVTNIFVGPMKSQKEASKTAKKISSSLHLRPAVIKSKPIPIKKSR